MDKQKAARTWVNTNTFVNASYLVGELIKGGLLDYDDVTPEQVLNKDETIEFSWRHVLRWEDNRVLVSNTYEVERTAAGIVAIDVGNLDGEEVLAIFSEAEGRARIVNATTVAVPLDTVLALPDVETFDADDEDEVRENCDCTQYEDAGEVLEWWIVDGYVARELREQGEHLVEALGLTFWGRTCCGQALCMDGCIQRIAVGQ